MIPDTIQEHTPPMMLDITRETCPMTFVRVRLALDRLSAGALLRVRLRGEEPRRNVPATAIAQGHAVLDVVELADDVIELTLRKA